MAYHKRCYHCRELYPISKLTRTEGKLLCPDGVDLYKSVKEAIRINAIALRNGQYPKENKEEVKL